MFFLPVVDYLGLQFFDGAGYPDYSQSGPAATPLAPVTPRNLQSVQKAHHELLIQMSAFEDGIIGFQHGKPWRFGLPRKPFRSTICAKASIDVVDEVGSIYPARGDTYENVPFPPHFILYDHDRGDSEKTLYKVVRRVYLI